MKLWNSRRDDLEMELQGKQLFHDFECGGYLPVERSSLLGCLEQMAKLDPQQLVFWHSSDKAVLVCSYYQPDLALSSIAFWAGKGLELRVAPAAEFSRRSRPAA